jgi:response regulator RpfG family c-di-GMP phosphodiesterase
MNPSDTTILVVDDEPVVLDTVRDGLIGHGYQVLSATGGDEALQVAQAHQGPIAPAVVDVVMPAMIGPEVINVVVHGVTAGDPLLVKPFRLDTLGRKIHDILDYRSPFSRPLQPPR